MAPPYFSSRDDGYEKSTVENTTRDTAVRYTTRCSTREGKKKRKKETGKRITGDRRTPTKQQILHERERRRNMNETKKDEIIKDGRRCFRRNQSMPPRKIYRCVIFRFFIISISRLSICIRFPRWTMFISLHPCDIARNWFAVWYFETIATRPRDATTSILSIALARQDWPRGSGSWSRDDKQERSNRWSGFLRALA